MDFHALAPKKYKRSVVSGFVNIIYRACSDWGFFQPNLDKARTVFARKTLPSVFP